MIKKYIEMILNKYKSAQKQSFAGNSIAKSLRRDFPDYLKSITDYPENYEFIGSAGRGMWTFSPWVAILNKKVTTSVQKGFFMVYLFREDMEGAYLSLNQGMGQILKSNSEDKTKSILRSRVIEFRKKLDNKLSGKLLEEIDLGVVKSEYGSYYEAGNIYAKFYSKKSLPSENVFLSDYKELLNLYNSIVNEKK